MTEKKSKVIKAARELFSRYGYKKVSMDAIAKKSSVTKKTIYTYFKDKDELLKYLVYEELDKMKKIISEIEKKQMPFSEKIHEMICALLDYKQSNKLLSTLACEAEDIPSPSVKQCADIINKSIRNAIKDKIERAVQNGELKPCNIELMSFIIYKIYVATMFEWDDSEKTIDKEELADALTTILNNWIV